MANTRGIKRERSTDEPVDNKHIDDGSSGSALSQKRGKFERSFVPSWLERFDWLMFDSSRNVMFCVLCKKYSKNNAFTEGCHNFRRDNLNKHVATNDHKYCVDQEAVCKDKVVPAAEVQSPTPSTPGNHSSAESSRSSGIFSASSNSLPQSPASLQLPSPTSFAIAKNPNATVHAPVPLLPYSAYFPTYIDSRYAHFNGEANDDMKSKDNGMPITPHYITHPPFPYMPGSSSYRSAVELPSANPALQKSPHIARQNGPHLDENELVLKVRVANSTEQDFIEIEIEKTRLNFDYVLSTICRELSVNPSTVHKLRKLPNTIVRKDKDVHRLVDFQELELVLTNRASSEASRNYSSSVSPRHVDVVY